MRIHFKIVVLLITTVLVMLSSCHRQQRVFFTEDEKLPKKILGTSDREIIALRGQLEKQNVKVVSIGQNNLISIPSHALFADQSPRLIWAGYSNLNTVIRYIKQFRSVSIHVRAFSSPYVSDRRERALTLSRARAVADYMDQQGVDTRFLFTSGLGSDKPISRSHQGGDESLNSRVEITFRRQVA